MEESEKRRERLRAMRMEAAQAANGNNSQSSESYLSLTNPLVETPAAPLPQLQPHGTPRFDYYTDPMSAFSGNRRSKVSHQNPQDYCTPPRPRNSVMTTPMHQAHTYYSPDQRVLEAPGPYQSSSPYRSPVTMASPFGMQQGTPPAFGSGPSGTPGYCSPSNISMVGNFAIPVTPPSSWIGPTGSPRYSSPSNVSRVGTFASPHFVRETNPSFNSGQGRGQLLQNHSGHGSGRGGHRDSNSGRGRGQWSGCEKGLRSGCGSGRGLGSRNSVLAEFRPDLFYSKSMVEDPWKFLTPVVRKDTFSTPDSWLPESVRAKKIKISDSANKSSSEPSLAEFLAASFQDAVEEES